MKEFAKIMAEVLFAAAAIFAAGNDRCIDFIKAVAIRLFALIFITAIGVKVVEWLTGQ